MLPETLPRARETLNWDDICPSVLRVTLNELEKLAEQSKCPECSQRFPASVVRLPKCGHILCQVCSSECTTCSVCDAPSADSLAAARDEKLECIMEKLAALKDLLKSIELQEQFLRREKRNAVGETRLHTACKRGNAEQVAALLKDRCAVNVQDNAGWTPLHEAVAKGSLDVVRLLLEAGCLVNVPGDCYLTPLHTAVSQSNEAMVKLLLQHGADPNMMSYSGDTPRDAANASIAPLLACVRPVHDTTKVYSLGASIEVYISADLSNFAGLRFLRKKHVQLSEKLSKWATHVVVADESSVTLEVLKAVVLGAVLVKQSWVATSEKADRIVGTGQFELQDIPGLPPGLIDQYRTNRLNLLPTLFDGCLFYIIRSPNAYRYLGMMDVSTEGMKELIEGCGGMVVKREPRVSSERIIYHPWHARNSTTTRNCVNYIIYRDDLPHPALQYKMQAIKHASYSWIFDCIFSQRILDID